MCVWCVCVCISHESFGILSSRERVASAIVSEIRNHVAGLVWGGPNVEPDAPGVYKARSRYVMRARKTLVE